MTVLVLCALLSRPVQVLALPTHTGQNSSTTSVNANVFLTNGLLLPLFQSELNAQLPQALGNAIASMVNQMPPQNRGWATQMANALLQPSAALLSVTPQSNGLLATFKLSLYPGDLQATTTSLVLSFSVRDASTLQITTLPPADGTQSLLSGPITTVHVPIGALNTIVTTPHCGDADLNIHLKFPISFGQQVTPSRSSPAQPASSATPTTYIELPASSLAQLGSSMGVLMIRSNLTASNIRLGVQGHNLTLTVDIFWYGFGIGTAVSTLIPGASNGSLSVHIQNTNLQILNSLITFPVNSYNQQIEQTLNADLNGALTGTFLVEQAEVGGNAHLPCVASNSLVLAGTLALK